LPIALDQAHALLIAERSHDATKITEAISAVLAANSETSLLEIEEVFRDAGSSVYLIAEPELTIVIGGLAQLRSTGLECRHKKADMRWHAFKLPRPRPAMRRAPPGNEKSHRLDASGPR